MRTKWTFEKVVDRAASLLQKGWEVKKFPTGEINFKPPGENQFCLCTLEAVGYDHIGPEIGSGSLGEVERVLQIPPDVRKDIVEANDWGIRQDLDHAESERRVSLLLQLSLPLDRGWQKYVTPDFAQKTHTHLASVRRVN